MAIDATAEYINLYLVTIRTSSILDLETNRIGIK